MKIIKDTDGLARICTKFSDYDYVAVDTEFLRESTFWAKLCLIQMASSDDAIIIDVLAPGLDLNPFFALMVNESVIKIFHAGRQDIEIIYNLAKVIPHPLFDTQIAAMVCGYGDMIAYDQLVYKMASIQIDKSSRFTDWEKRPLTSRQLNYALADVTHLSVLYPLLKARVEKQRRSHWVLEEMKILTSTSTYDCLPEQAWQRLKLRVRKPRDFAVMQAVAEWREWQARRDNVPRGWIIKDDAIHEISVQHPDSFQTLCAIRSLPKKFEKCRYAYGLLAVVAKAVELSEEQLPLIPALPPSRFMRSTAAIEMMKILLKLISEKHGVAARLIATTDELEKIAIDDHANVPALQGWRRELFGRQALKLKAGKIMLGFDGNGIVIIES